MRLIRLLLLGALAVTGAALVPLAPAEASAECIPASECCKVCSKGKACGNSCISERKTCHKGRGCACDVEEICE